MKSKSSNTLVYSTSEPSGRVKQKPEKAARLPAPGPCKMRLETKGRGGKAVTVLFNLPFSAEQAKEWMRELQNTLSCGATFKNDQIELRGDLRERVESFFAKKNQKIIRAGG